MENNANLFSASRSSGRIAASPASSNGISSSIIPAMLVPLAEVQQIKNAIATAVASGQISMMGKSAFEGVVNVAGTYVRFTGAFTQAGIIISNVMGNALQK